MPSHLHSLPIEWSTRVLGIIDEEENMCSSDILLSALIDRGMYLNLAAILILNPQRWPMTLLASCLTKYRQKPHYTKLWIQCTYSEAVTGWESLLALLDYTDQVSVGKNNKTGTDLLLLHEGHSWI
jgi:hypothetical protein